MKEIIRFTADWCGPCRMYKPTWEEVVNENSDKYKFIVVDIDNDTTGLAAKFQIRSVPSTVVVETDGSWRKETGNISTSKLLNLIKG
jgi:thioredoxin-like negative regulator of GroEL|tara:strand:+ start:376 stop:636 length:261 start_codon:yes stop_codon:yes gene_type:complete